MKSCIDGDISQEDGATSPLSHALRVYTMLSVPPQVE